MAYREEIENSLSGQLLVSMPGMQDPRFDKTVIFICAHSPDGAMGQVLLCGGDALLKDLPEKKEVVVKIPFDEGQKKIYRDVAISWNEKVKESITLKGVAKSQLLMLTALLRLRQTCSDPSSIRGIGYKLIPPKLKLLH